MNQCMYLTGGQIESLCKLILKLNKELKDLTNLTQDDMYKLTFTADYGVIICFYDYMVWYEEEWVGLEVEWDIVHIERYIRHNIKVFVNELAR